MTSRGPVRILTVAIAFAICSLLFVTVVSVDSPHAGPPVALSGLTAAAEITRDTKGIAHIQADNPHDLYFLQGYVHAQDRFFQMDFLRHQANGTIAELVGSAALPTDVQLRTLGLRRAAERSLAAYSPRVRAALDAYADGVNAFLASNPLPAEYGALELTQIDAWTALDSAAVGKAIAFGLSFSLADIDFTIALVTYRQAGLVLGFNGTNLFFEDLFRSEPFDHAATIPDALTPLATLATAHSAEAGQPDIGAGAIDAAGMALVRRYLKRVADLPLVRQYVTHDGRASSNEWAVSGELTASGSAMVANDPHLSLGTPAVWYPIHLRVGSLDVIGNSLAGAPFVIVGHNRRVAWGPTVNPVDATDVFQERVEFDASSPSLLSIVHAGGNEPIIPIPETFRANRLDGVLNNVDVVTGTGIPHSTLIVPRRSNGPIIQLGAVPGPALSVQYTGFGATRELEAFMLLDEASGLDDFRHGLEFFDAGSLNFAYADVEGNIAYLTAGEAPIREDLQSGGVIGLPPFFIRNGTGGNDWLAVQHPQPNQSGSFEILPAGEMPHLINPGFFVNSNNDPIGTTLDNNPLNDLRPGGGILYLSPGYDGFRAGRATALINQKLAVSGRLSFEDMEEMQADTVMTDATVFVPYILQAFARGQAAGANAMLAGLTATPAIVNAVGRLAQWDFTTPTGIPQGYDAGDTNGVLSPPSSGEIAASVAATIYSVWRSQILKNTVDAPLTLFGLPKPPGPLALAALRHLLDTYSATSGVGASGLGFFNVPGVASAADRRDILLLKSVSDALTLLAGPPFQPAFGLSTDQNDYLWGKLHRIVFAHVLGGPFSIPPAGGAFPAPLPGLPGIPTDGGFETLDRSDHDVRAASADAFMFDGGPSNRSVYEAAPGRLRGQSSLPGGPSGVLGSPFYLNLLPAWLTNEAYPLLQRHSDLEENTMSVLKFVPGS
jgi:penicillin amidase